METEAVVRKLQLTGDHAPPDQVQGDGGEGVQQQRGQLGDVVKHEGVLPDHQGQPEAAQGEAVVGQEPDIYINYFA